MILKALFQAYKCNGSVDILINCAGFALCGTFKDTESEDFRVIIYFSSLLFHLALLDTCFLN